ncbi:ABC transporter ATP-binding protein [Ahniella affigens]|uniref:ABC transporter ATP-binding protein n=1 Tax=Ahniella affigens TaxID=2021234 RepID=A0A2P1PQM7_9GAMM|nr:ABC transporter ATP-binding protein [Ahniella affigens]AVP97145.1 ABC transporter ATP-binding protein [Ahniella affigens]
MLPEFVLEAENLRKSYTLPNRPQFFAVNDVSLHIQRGEIYAFLGPNGAGKTSTIKMISGLLEPSTGIVRIAGMDPFTDRHALAQIGTVLEGNRNLYWRMTCHENLIYFGALKGMSFASARARSRTLLDRFDLAAKRDAQVQSLSRGMQQKLAIAVALMHEPNLLVLDEPTLGLDAHASIEVTRLIRDLVADGVSILLTTHQLDVAEALAHRVAIMSSGRIIKEARMADLLAEFAKNVYEIQLSEQVDDGRMRALEAIGAVTYRENCLQLACDPVGLYEALSIIRPAPVHSVRRHQSDLTSIFIALTQKGVAAHA